MGNWEATEGSREAKKHKENYDWNENTTFKLPDSTGPPNNISLSLSTILTRRWIIGDGFSFIPLPPKKERGRKREKVLHSHWLLPVSLQQNFQTVWSHLSCFVKETFEWVEWDEI